MMSTGTGHESIFSSSSANSMNPAPPGAMYGYPPPPVQHSLGFGYPMASLEGSNARAGATPFSYSSSALALAAALGIIAPQGMGLNPAGSGSGGLPSFQTFATALPLNTGPEELLRVAGNGFAAYGRSWNICKDGECCSQSMAPAAALMISVPPYQPSPTAPFPQIIGMVDDNRIIDEEEYPGEQSSSMNFHPQSVAAADASSSFFNSEEPQIQFQNSNNNNPINIIPPRKERRGGSRVTSMACKECGNKAKKDCSHMRCRSCCKSLGSECPTHVRSTWVSASRRRERQRLLMEAAASGHPVPKSKRGRMFQAMALQHSPPQNEKETSSGDTFTSHHLRPNGTTTTAGKENTVKGALPVEFRGEAVFKCVRVTGIEDEENDYAYRAQVKIGGHIFKGLLYDQGPTSACSPSFNNNLPPHSSTTPTIIDPLVAAAIVYGTSSNALSSFQLCID